MSKRIIVDIDAGTDDAVALVLLLEHNVDILAITCVNGNTCVQNVYNNVRRILKLCNRTDIPIYMGAVQSLLNKETNNIYYHGKDGFGDLEYEDDNITIKSTTGYKTENKVITQSNIKFEHNAIEIMNKIVSENTGEISLLCLGPLTNIALATKVYFNFANNVKEIFIMGGNHKGVGNTTSAAEFNFFVDPEAAYIVLHHFTCPITILPWETCLEHTISFDWRTNVLGKLNHPILNILNAAEKTIYSNKEKDWISCDAYLAALFLNPNMIKKSYESKVSVELHGIQTRAQMVIKHTIKDEEPNAIIVTEIDNDLFKTILLKFFNK